MSPASRERRGPPSEQQKTEQVASLCRAIDAICDAWDLAVDAANSRGYGSGGSFDGTGSSSGFWVVEFDDDGNRTNTEYVPTAHGDPTSAQGLRSDTATRWYGNARRHLALLLRLDPGAKRGKFYPPALRSQLHHAAEYAVEYVWDEEKNLARLIENIHKLANTARREWPPTPKFGQVVDGIKVGERSKSELEVCSECKQPIPGTKLEPVKRIDGQPYCLSPCFETVRKRRARARKAER